MNHVITGEKIQTDAGMYTVEFIADEDADQPYDEGFGLITMSDRHTITIDSGTALPGDKGPFGPNPRALIIRALKVHNGAGDAYDYENRSGAAIVRYMRLIGVKGATLVNDYLVDEPTTNRFDHVGGIAWAPDDVTPEHADDYVKGVLGNWRAWANGDVFGYRVLDPSGDEIDACWGFYGFDTEHDDVLDMATDNAKFDANERIEKSNLVGAGFLGLI